MKAQNKYLVVNKFCLTNKKLFFLAVVIPLIFSGCATIFGGKKYNAHIKTNRPNAEIIVNNKLVGKGSGVVSVVRKDANKLNIILKEKGCEDTIFNFKSRKIRSFALAGTITPWAVFIGGILYWVSTPKESSGGVVFLPGPILVGVFFATVFGPGSIVNMANSSSLYKPDINELGVYKINYKNYEYRLQSTCITNNHALKNSSNLKGVVYLKNGSIIRGNIIELKPNESFKIQTSDGSIFVISFDEIEKFTQE